MTKQDQSELDKDLTEIKRHLKRISGSFKTRNVIGRAIVTGIFTALGATIGLGLLLFFSAQFFTSLRVVPFVDDLLRITKLDVLIEKQISDLDSNPEAPTDEGTEGEEPQTGTSGYQTFDNPTLPFRIDLPINLSLVDESLEEGYALLTLQGTSYVTSLRFYVINESQQAPELNGFERTQSVETSFGATTLRIFEEGAEISTGESFSQPVFAASVTKDDVEVLMIALGNTQYPKISREVFLKSVQSVGN